MKHLISDGKGEEVAKGMVWLAWRACGGPVGMGVLQDQPGATKENVWSAMTGAHDYGGSPFKSPKSGEVSADYVFGRMMKLYFRFDKDTIDIRDEVPHPAYQGWAVKYPSYATLVQEAIDVVNNSTQ